MDDGDCMPSRSEVLLWRLGRLWAWYADGRLGIPPQEWDLLDIDTFAGIRPVTACIELEVEGAHGHRRWHLNTGEVLFYTPGRGFPFKLVSVAEWTERQAALEAAS